MNQIKETQGLPSPFPWQEEALKAWVQNGRRGIAKVATGAGKTIFALHCALSMPEDTRIKIVVPTLALARQWKKEIQSYNLRGGIGEWNGDRHTFGDFRFMIYVVDSARYSISTHILLDMKQGRHVLLILDECQRYGSEWNRKIFHFMEAPSFRKDLYSSLGLSATPDCVNYNHVLRPCIGDVFFDYDLKQAEEDKLVNPYYLFHVAVSFDSSEESDYIDLSDKISRTYSQLLKTHVEFRTLSDQELFMVAQKSGEKGDDLCSLYVNLVYQRSNLVEDASQRLDCANQLILSLDKRKRIIVFSEKIEQAEQLKQKLNKENIPRVRIYHSEMDEQVRKNALDDFRDGEARILLCCKALDEGLNVPDADVGIVLSSTKSERQRIQRLGRVLRSKEGKDPTCLYYIYVKGTNDPNIYLGSNNSASEVMDFTFQNEAFDTDSYYDLAGGFLESLDSTGGLKDKEKRSVIRHCLEMGAIRGDYFLSSARLKEKKEEAITKEDKDYYEIMADLSDYYHKETKGDEN